MTTKAVQANTVSERFTNLVVREFSGAAGAVQLSGYQKKLIQHLFIKVDAQLKDLEAKRIQSNRQVAAYEWNNVNMEKLAIDSVHRVDLGLDALIPNHISPIPYWNKKKQKYDLDLRVGYEGKDYYRRKMTMDEPLDIIYELVYSSDEFRPIKKSLNQKYDAYEFNITKPFDRGEIIGGFGYIVYADQNKNELVLVSEAEFQKSKKAAKSNDFWDKHPEKMRMKTLVHRTTERLKLDPEKVNASYLMVEKGEGDGAMEPPPSNDMVPESEIQQNANQEPIDIPSDAPSNDVEKQEHHPQRDQHIGEAEKAEILAAEQAEAEAAMADGPGY